MSSARAKSVYAVGCIRQSDVACRSSSGLPAGHSRGQTGLSGWHRSGSFSYPHWRGRLYPDKLPQKRWFDYYCTTFASVELNVTFYRLLKPDTFTRWQLESPPGFTFSLKGSRFITHVKRLTDPEEPLARFFERAMLLGEKLRVILWQLPPGFSCNIGRLELFLEFLARYPARNSLEFRHERWCCEEVVLFAVRPELPSVWPTGLILSLICRLQQVSSTSGGTAGRKLRRLLLSRRAFGRCRKNQEISGGWARRVHLFQQ